MMLGCLRGFHSSYSKELPHVEPGHRTTNDEEIAAHFHAGKRSAGLSRARVLEIVFMH